MAERESTPTVDPPTVLKGDPVLASALGLIALQIVFRAWVMTGAWFYYDDFRLLDEAARAGSPLTYLFSPYDGQLMPVGRALASLVQAAGPLSWTAAALTTLGCQLLADLAVWWMLRTVLGRRWEVLLLLALYLTTTLTLPAFLWWAAALNQIPLQAVLAAGVAAGWCYLRTRRLRWALATSGVLIIGLLTYVKALLLLPVLAVLALAYFVPWRERRGRLCALARMWPLALACLVPAVAYLSYFTLHVPQITRPPKWSVSGDLFGNLVLRSFGSAVAGGPWHWAGRNPPVLNADPPAWAVSLAWIGILGVVSVAHVLRARSWRAWAAPVVVLTADFVLLLTTRAPVVGKVAGLQFRYLTDTAPLVVLGLGLAFLTLPLPEGSTTRPRPLASLRVPALLTPTLVLVVAVASLASSVPYVDAWHHDNPSGRYVQTLRHTLGRAGTVDLADAEVPPNVIPALSYPGNLLDRVTGLMRLPVHFATVSSDLQMVDPLGRLEPAVLRTQLSSPPGPREGCGYLVRDTTLTEVPLGAHTVGVPMWVRVGYLSGRAGTVQVSAGRDLVVGSVHKGLGSLFVHTRGDFSSVRVTPLDDQLALCIDRVDVGQLANRPTGPSGAGGLRR